MTFDSIKKAIKDYTNLSSPEADTRIGEAINRHYKRVTSAIGMDVTRRVSRNASTTNGVQTVTFSNIEKIDRVIDATTATAIRLLPEVEVHQIRSQQPTTTQPQMWAPYTTTADSVTILLDTQPQTTYSLVADGWAAIADLEGADSPAFPESFHDILTWSVLAEELLKKEKIQLAAAYEQKALKLLGELNFHYADSPTRLTQQGSQPSSILGGGGTGGGSLAATAYTQTALITFDLGSGVAPFAVAQSDAAVVTNLDSDKLDGQHGTYYLSRTNHTGTQDHGSTLSGLSEDDHTQYGLLAGRSGGQTLRGGTGNSDGLTLQASSDTATNASFIKFLIQSAFQIMKLSVNDGVLIGNGNGPSGGFNVASSGTTMPGSDWIAWFRREATAASNECLVRVEHFSGTQVTQPIIAGIANRGTFSSKTLIATDDYLLVLDGRGYDGSSNNYSEYALGVSDTAAQIAMRAGSSWSGTNHESYITFYTTPNGSTTPQLRVGIRADGALDLRSGQVLFPATQVPSSDANMLDDYEEGSWTPIIGGSGGQSGQTYSIQTGRYVKIGRLVYASFAAVFSGAGGAKGTITTSVQIKGLPFTATNDAIMDTSVLRWANLATNWVNITAQVTGNTTTANVRGCTAAAAANTTDLATADINDNSEFRGCIVYEATA